MCIGKGGLGVKEAQEAQLAICVAYVASFCVYCLQSRQRDEFSEQQGSTPVQRKISITFY